MNQNINALPKVRKLYVTWYSPLCSIVECACGIEICSDYIEYSILAVFCVICVCVILISYNHFGWTMHETIGIDPIKFTRFVFSGAFISLSIAHTILHISFTSTNSIQFCWWRKKPYSRMHFQLISNEVKQILLQFLALFKLIDFSNVSCINTVCHTRK